MAIRLKAMVVVAFSLRLPVIAACGVRLYYLNLTIYSTDPTLQAAFSVIWTQIELDYSILASAISCLGPFISPFTRETNSNYQDTRHAHKFSTQRSITDKDFSLSSIANRGHQNRVPATTSEGMHDSVQRSQTAERPLFRNDHQYSHTTTVSHNPNSNGRQRSFDSSESRRMIIRKEVEWSVERDNSAGGDDDRIDTVLDGRSDGAVTAPPTAETHHL